ncbi:hypothetical protein A9P82_11545 [Arachidicoccus ginsenosidimutans]|nr:hypothetical protein A9P82_11545 [Arachidicoccus sp. BS20]
MFVILLFAIIGFTNCNKKFDAPPEEPIDSLPVNFSIQQLKALHTVRGSFQTITDDYVISGIVTANDSSGNFYNEIVIQDNSGAIPVNISGNNLYTSYPVGRKIFVRLKGLTLGDYSGAIQLGGGINNSSTTPRVDGIASSLADEYIAKGSFNNEVMPVPVTLDQLAIDDAMQNPLQSRLVVLDGFEFQNSDLTKTYADSSKTASYGSFYLKTCSSSDSLELYNSSYAYFADIKVPQGNGSITGIFTPYVSAAGKKYKEIVIRDTSDIQFYDTRCDGYTDAPGQPMTIAQIRALYKGNNIRLGSNYTVGGVVISDAASKNISSGSFVLQSGNSGISVYAGGTINYNIGDSVVLELTASDSLLSYQGALELKLHYGVALPNVVASGKVIAPVIKTIEEITSSLAKPLGDAENMEFTLVQINNASVPNSTFSGNKTLSDTSGSISLYTLSSAVFAGNTLPEGYQNWIGYAHNYNAAPEFSIRNTNDITASSDSSATVGTSFTATYDFSDVSASSGATDPTPPPVVDGLHFDNFIAKNVSDNSSASGRFSFKSWSTGATNGSDNFTGSIDTAKYYEVTITPENGKTLSLANITLIVQRSGTGVRQIAIRASIDGFENNLPVSINPENDNLSIVAGNVIQINDAVTTAQNGTTINLGNDFSSINTAVTFRFYGFNAESGSGTFSIDNVAFYGKTE